VTAISGTGGDYESIKTISAVDARQVRLKYSADVPNTDMLSPGPPVRRVDLTRAILAADLQSAHMYQQVFLEDSADLIPETTSLGASAATLRTLKAGGEAEFGYSNAYTGVKLDANRSKSPNYYSYMQFGKLRRVGDGTAHVSVLVNDAPVDLPAVRAQGEFAGDKAEFFFLDDPSNPLTLAFRIGIDAIKPLVPEAVKMCENIRRMGKSGAAFLGGLHCDRPNGGDADALRVVKIAFHCAPPLGAPAGPPGSSVGQPPTVAASGDVGRLEQALAARKPVDVYSIYFGFNSDSIRDESEPTLKEIAELMRRHPEWKLGVSGHTDSIGDDAYNLGLSSRRAAAVKAALGSRYGIALARLATNGFGRSQPRDTNDTLEGRARNRRVELVRTD